ncbi:MULTISPECIES: diguanylate cyclase [Halomonadaceae]|jgi:GGDEF domain-containing protein|uniref:Diguanylate cyclase n=3 Tax=Halomonadaceae TaxID=28256 RepID=A0A9X4YBI6_9GAMM|nr:MULTISPECIES: diguanylate cyclase [Halomonas]MYL26208.1 diguanylate cyclase [Halomonas utahensis]MYL73230.1 diguanylate cyclase [Halomonas sp. 22501_18_FS]
MQSPSIGCLTRDPGSFSESRWHYASSLNELREQGEYDVVLVDLDAADAADVVFLLRCDARYHLTLIYAGRDRTGNAPELSDGSIPTDPNAITEAWRKWHQRLSEFNRGRYPERFDEYVLAWLWTRPEGRLKPVRHPHHAQFYYYPLLSAFADNEPVNEMVWLQLMMEQGWLERGPLTDRIRLCTHCGSARLNYVDVCPDCHALEIAREPSLHCFTCGHVAPQDHFLKQGLMLCPNCLTRLRHIGSDYDRPLENYRCRACQSFFVDAEVEVRCLDCDTHHTPDELRIREVRPYSLSEQGRLRCRQGFSGEAQAESHFGRLNLVSANAFTNLLNWQIQQSRRYGETAHGSLVLLRFANLGEALSQERGTTLLDSLIDRIRETIRETDRCARTRDELLWLLLPHTDRQGMDRLRERLTELNRLFREQDGIHIDLRTVGITLPENLLPQEDSDLLMARLGGEVS